MPKPTPHLPTREQILDFIATSQTAAGKREIAKAFGLTAQQKIALKALLKDMADEGLIDSAPGRSFHKMGGVPKVTVLRIVDADDGGNIWAVPENWQAETPPPKLRVREKGRRGALGIGDRILARTEEAGNGWIAHPMKALAKGEELVLGVLRQEGGKMWLTGVEKRDRSEYLVADAGDGEAGDLVLAEKGGRPPRITVRVTEVLGDPFAPRSFSLIAIHKLGIPTVFTPETLAEATRMAAQPLATTARICARSQSSRSTLPTRAITTMPCGRRRMTIPATKAGGRRSSRLPTSVSTCGPAPISIARRGGAAIRFTSPTASCRCCPKSSPPTSVR